MRVEARLCRAWHDNNAADTIKGAALHIGAVAGLTATGNPGMTHLSAGERLEPTDHGRLVTTVTSKLSRIWQMVSGCALGTKIIVASRTRETCK